ncbi:MAG: alpha-mannosidase [Planctomycetes bacterium GWF2_41_51]|nr:MAG: alpha-mannosidase [Planctomycetes bacterium GWF2_41_51]
MINYLEERLNNILSFKDAINSQIYTTIGHLEIEAYLSKEPLSYQDRTKGEKRKLRPGDKWGDLFDCSWFHFTGSIPPQGSGKHIVLLIDVNGEACVFDESGNPIRGLTNGSSVFERKDGSPCKKVLQFNESAKSGEIINIWADAGCNDLFGKLSEDGRIAQADIAICNDNIRSLYYDYWTLSELSLVIDKDSARYAKIMPALYNAMQTLQSFTDEEVEIARKILAVELDRKNSDPCLAISAVGNAHIDLAWLWPIRETIRKAARTFSTTIDLMDNYPDYKFGASQAQLYLWVKKHYPVLYKRIKEKIKQRRWELHGGMWVEADANVPCGESFIRQFLYGKRFFKDEFGIDVKSLWLPDTFGYPAALPQIMKTCGADYFVTQKLSWNSVNKFPHHTFYWHGIDSTAVLTHMLPEETYNSHAGPRAISKIEKKYAQKDISDRALLLFGIGNGGGGPDEAHLEQLERLKNLNGVVPVEQEFSSKFFKRIDKDNINYPRWQGELYLEKHQGTLTTQARNKKYNRLIEKKLHDLEFLSCIANIYGLNYPQKQIDEIWQEVLLYQFHDILPGSSINRVYDESTERYEIMLDEVTQMTETALESICQNIDTSGMKEPAIIFNTLSWNRSEWLKIDNRWFKAEVDSMGFAAVDLTDALHTFPELKAQKQLLENDKLRLQFADDGSLISVRDKVNNFECIKQGKKANVLKVYTDKADAWEIPYGYWELPPETFKLQNVNAYLDGPRAVIEQTYNYNLSTIMQQVVLTTGSSRIDFITEADWNETHKMLRTDFPIDIFTDYATCDIQFGSVRRPTHTNTSWDKAKYEICAHKFIDISQTDRGVSLLNDCKYGFRVADNILDINLLRSSQMPGVGIDRGKHQFTYSLYPHTGNHIDGNTARRAYELNAPLLAKKISQPKQTAASPSSFLSIDSEAVIIETVKKTQDSNDIIIRTYENTGAGCYVILKANLPLKKVWLSDGMENKIQNIDFENNEIALSFRPWEIKTIKIVLQGNK